VVAIYRERQKNAVHGKPKTFPQLTLVSRGRREKRQKISRSLRSPVWF